jgi:hypothetical protein
LTSFRGNSSGPAMIVRYEGSALSPGPFSIRRPRKEGLTSWTLDSSGSRCARAGCGYSERTPIEHERRCRCMSSRR